MQETYPKLQDAPQDQEAWNIFQALAVEFGAEAGQTTPQAELYDVYTRNMYIKGRPINDSFHFGQTLINDYGRPYQGGFNALDGFYGEGRGLPFLSRCTRGVSARTRSCERIPNPCRQLIRTG